MRAWIGRIAQVRKELGDFDDIQYRARRVVELMATVLQGSLLHENGTAAIAEAFCATQLDGDRGAAFGTLPIGVDTAAILDRVRPEPAAPGATRPGLPVLVGMPPNRQE